MDGPTVANSDRFAPMCGLARILFESAILRMGNGFFALAVAMYAGSFVGGCRSRMTMR